MRVLCLSLFWYALICVLSIVPLGSFGIYLCTIFHYLNGSHASKLFNEVSFCNHPDEEERAGRFAFIVFQKLYVRA